MKALIITYYWVPAGGSGVQRWLKFVKYLRDFGIEPIVYTVDSPNYPIVDDSLEKDIPEGIEVLRNGIWEPNTVLSNFSKKKTSAGFLNSKPSFFGKIVQYIRANYFIPDARKFWIQPSVNYLKNYLSKNKIDVIITTGPPHSLHLIGLQLKKELGIKWIADFRDPWTDIDYFHQLPLTKKSKLKHERLERQVLQHADTVLVIGKTMQENFKRFSNPVHVLTNGFDTDIISESIPPLDETFSITHIGMMNADRNPKSLWKVLAEISKENDNFSKDLEVKLIGKIADEVTEGLEKYSLKNVTKIDYVPHKEVQQYQRKSQILLLAVNKVPSAKGIITGKIFEYLQAKRPILAIGPEAGDLAEILKQTNAGFIVDFDDEIKLKDTILKLYDSFKKNILYVNSTNIEQYQRKEITEKLAKIIQTTVNS